MQFRWHILFGFVASYILVEFFNFSLLAGIIIFLSSWIIDIDHYPWYAFETRNWNPKKAIEWYVQSVPKWKKLSTGERRQFRNGIYVLHDVFFWIALIILALFYNFVLWILIGIFIHIFADWGHAISKGMPIYSKVSCLYTMKKNRNKKSLSKL